MVDFQQQLKQEMARMQENNGGNDWGEVEYPSSKLKHEQLYFDKNNSEFLVRILPGANGNFFSQEFKEIFLNTRNSKGTDINTLAIIGANQTPENSKLMANLLQWQQEKRVPNNFNREATPTRRFFVNAVRVMVQNGQPVMETDQNGDLVVRLLKLPVSAYNSIISKLGDEMLVPNGADEYSFIGVNNAYPIKIQKPAPGQMSYTVDVYQKDLGPLPQGWESQLEDLAYQATPSEEYNGEFIDYLIDVVNGTEKSNDNSAPAQAPTQGFGQPQQNQGFNQPQQNQQAFNQPAQGSGDPFSQPQQQTPTTPQQNTQQVPDNSGFGNSAPQQQPQSAPQQQNTGGFDQGQQENNQPTQTPEQPQQGAPTPPPTGGAESVEDVLAKMQKGVSQ